ncbi:hypothetical protein Bca52824_023787 [Brassica carinata]|uniref:Uncharacterized protein n=1 Tax=Brassica carinata TaxID=52824 RepID=A0A8X7VIZ7_BRACI|nr:hypothetical protein Bca52824_023787 [Brassica carinata]
MWRSKTIRQTYILQVLNKVFPKSSNTLEYDIRKEGDPFKAPHPILAVDPI